MVLKHADIWLAIDRLAEKNGLSPSGLARKAGLSPTIFNPSKRLTAKRRHWPSTESIARILEATGTHLEDFVALTTEAPRPRQTLPYISQSVAGKGGCFDDEGYPAGKGWEDIHFPDLNDPHAFALEIVGQAAEPVYREGDRLILVPAEKPRRGDRVVIRMKTGELVIRQLGRDNLRTIELVSLNPAFPPMIMARTEIIRIYRIYWASQ